MDESVVQLGFWRDGGSINLIRRPIMAEKRNLTFIDVSERPRSNSLANKRQRLIEGLSKQATEIERFAAGHWSPRMWFWADDDGKYYLEVRYAKKPLPLSGSKSAILCQSLEDVAEKIDQLKEMVGAGELDTQIEAASEAIRTRFKKSK
jgi:hypothetical protein